jgi:MarR family transcriptional regulator, organic hydroperoxide resistance regulator
MGFDHRRTVTHRLSQAAHAYRVRAGGQLSRIGLHSGQESLLKALAGDDGMSMSDLAATLGVQPPTITKMISRLAAQDYVERRASSGDGRQAEVFLTERGKRTIATIDKVWKRMEKTALADIEDKDRKRLRKLLRQVERNLGGKRTASEEEDAEEEVAAE